MISGGVAYYVLRCPDAALSVALTGGALDVDHVVDLIKNPYLKVSIKDLVKKSDHLVERKTYYAPLHSYEFVLALIFIYVFYPGPILLGSIIGISLHVLSDIFTNRPYRYSYFFIYRYMKKFNKKDLFRPKDSI